MRKLRNAQSYGQDCGSTISLGSVLCAHQWSPVICVSSPLCLFHSLFLNRILFSFLFYASLALPFYPRPRLFFPFPDTRQCQTRTDAMAGLRIQVFS